tara:strand:+ start:6186 stop:6350 length:165 start_codon:yes stop_codon:yes gene_type:complete
MPLFDLVWALAESVEKQKTNNKITRIQLVKIFIFICHKSTYLNTINAKYQAIIF